MRGIEELKAVAIRKRYAWFDTGDFNLNIWFERTSNLFTNKFDDWLHLAWKESGVQHYMCLPATTKHGLHNGSSVIVPNQYKQTYQWISKGHGWGKGYHFAEGEFFAQKKVVQTWIDGNNDSIIDHVDLVDASTNVGINIHKMSPKGVRGGAVLNWSLGCSGLEEPDFIKIIPIVSESVKRYGDLFTVTWVESKDFEAIT